MDVSLKSQRPMLGRPLADVIEAVGDLFGWNPISVVKKNVGTDVFASGLVAKGGEWFGQITHPETKETYSTRFQQKDKDRWRLDGCTAAKVCLSGEFVRVK